MLGRSNITITSDLIFQNISISVIINELIILELCNSLTLENDPLISGPSLEIFGISISNSIIIHTLYYHFSYVTEIGFISFE